MTPPIAVTTEIRTRRWNGRDFAASGAADFVRAPVLLPGDVRRVSRDRKSVV